MPPGRTTLLIVNEHSRRGRGAADQAHSLLEAGGLLVHRAICPRKDGVCPTIRRLAGAVDLVVLGGGDGTIGAAAPALLETGLPLGILPLGTANDLARTLGIPTDLDAAARVVAAGRVRHIDLGEVNGHPFFNVASLGLGVATTRALTRPMKRRWGRFGYALATLGALARLRPFQAEIHLGDRVQPVRSVQIAVGNGHYYGGGLAVDEAAEIADGMLNLYSLETDRLWKLALIYPAFRQGRQGLWREVRTATAPVMEVRTRRPRAVTADGEIVTWTPARFRVLPGAVGVLVPG